MPLCSTNRLCIRHFVTDDAEFILRLLNERSFIDNIADRQVRSIADAERYLRDGPMASYAAHGHGLNCVVRRDSGEPIGMCGILKRDTLPHPDLGYALLPEHTGQGYAREAASAVMQHATNTLGIDHLLAIVNTDNTRSISLLVELGFRLDPGETEPGMGRYFWVRGEGGKEKGER
ncbi:MAG: GNAT family N-acetyltransferase [Gemmatimonadales bacterium]|nr:GNAT family N-acetyltransferase [Gemmatimonadales bacterium]MDZ4389605.1 GNAT family N-acetyltransferase [Gemmatimonadales bacterium]